MILPIVDLPDAFVDERGTIQPLVDLEIGSVQIITSKAGSVRGNHFHKTDWHYCYVVSGLMDYVYQSSGFVFRSRTSPGEMFYTPPGVPHAMLFLEDTVFVNIARNSRHQADYEEDLVRVKLV